MKFKEIVASGKPTYFVNCKTEDEAKKLLEACHDNGYIWANESSLKSPETCWSVEEENTCYCLNFVTNKKNIAFCSKQHVYDNNLGQVIDFEDIDFEDETESKVANEIARLEKQVVCLNELTDDLQKKISFLKSALKNKG